MAQRQAVLTGSIEQINKLITMAELINKNLQVGESKVDIHVPTLEERESQLRDAIIAFQLTRAGKLARK